jgi:histidinol-phosphatase (PHP family)
LSNHPPDKHLLICYGVACFDAGTKQDTHLIDDSEHKHNFHTHTYRCKHARGDVADYCEVALELGMETLGFSDHSALPDDRWLSARMPYEQLDDYVEAIDQARLDFPLLTVLKGMECEYLPRFRSFYEDELMGARQFDYLAGASHYFIDGQLPNGRNKWSGTYSSANDAPSLRAYADYTINMMSSGLFSFIAHPDLFGVGYHTWDANTIACSTDILNAARELDVAMELNALGMRKQAAQAQDDPAPLYPWLPFWQLAAELDAPMIVNSDAHRPEDLQGLAGKAHSLKIELGLREMDLSVLQSAVR